MSKQKGRVPYPCDSKPSSGALKSRTDPPMYCAITYLDGREPDDVIMEDGVEYERTDHIPIDLDAIPEHVLNGLARLAVTLTREYFSQPGTEERYQEWLNKRNERLCAQE